MPARLFTNWAIVIDENQTSVQIWASTNDYDFSKTPEERPGVTVLLYQERLDYLQKKYL